MAVAARRMLAAMACVARPRVIPITGFRSEDDHWGVCFVQESSVIAITPMKLHRLLIFLVSVAAGIAAGGCATTPTGRSQLMLFPEAEVEAMGVQAFSQIKAETPLSRDPDAIRIVRCVSFAIVDQLPAEYRAGGDWEVLVFDDTAVNAFALPGRKIGVYEGLFRAARNQHQLAAVVGHEVAHVIAHHANERVSTAYAAQTGVNLAQIMAGGSGTATGQLMGLLGVGATYGVILPFNRKQESEADIIGMEFMARAGFDPRQTIPLWENMGRTNDNAPPEFLSTHPSGETRIAKLNEHLPVAVPMFESARGRGLSPDCGF
jgi:predicted Zn-dependent protease